MGSEALTGMQRQRLDDFWTYRIHPSAIAFTSEGSSRSSSKAEVVQATFGMVNVNDEQVVAVKKLRYHRSIDQKEFSSVRPINSTISCGGLKESIIGICS